MERVCEDYRSWHLQNLKDPNKAAYFLLAALEDAMENDLPRHFVKAISDFRKASGNRANPFEFMIANLEAKEHAIVYRFLTKIAGEYIDKKQMEQSLELQA